MPKFNKRHYEALATLVQEYNERCGAHAAPMLVDMLAAMFKADNSRFDYQRFEHACQPGSNVRAKTAHLKVD